MTTEEMFQLLLNEVKEIKQGQARFEQRQEKFEQRQDRFETKLDTVAADVSQIKKDVSLLLEHDDIDTYNFNSAYKKIEEVDNKLDKVIADQKLDRRANQATINQLQAQVNAVEDRLDKAS